MSKTYASSRTFKFDNDKIFISYIVFLICIKTKRQILNLISRIEIGV